ncbi:MAG: fasciclin domain-containing protein [Bacteroidales bacterium]|jgi:transforming growth factor-beta-induced protein|nr:fasciclin domain-containing protein [Bacteroidales bacterium]
MKKQMIKIASRATALRFGLIIALGVFAASCSKEEISPVADVTEREMNIVEKLASFENAANGNGYSFDITSSKKDILVQGENKEERKAASAANGPTFSTLNVALARTGLAGVVSSNRLTVFAPTDAAFAALGLHPNNIASVPNLANILLYHVVDGIVTSDMLSNGFVPTANGAAVEINLDNSVFVNDAQVIMADIKARNGIIHAIDKVMLPPTMNLVGLAQSFAPEFSILVDAVIAADLTEVLATGGPFTVFAPTNAAFVALLGELGFNSLDEIPVEVLTQVLLYHVVEGRFFSSDLVSGTVPTLNGTFEVNTSNFTITDANERESNIDTSLINIQATNGVVHVIDRVILPELN